MFNNCHKGNETRIIIKNNKMICGKQESKLPTYTDISKYLQKLRDKRRVLTKEYAFLYNELLNDKSINKNDYEKIVNDIRDIDTRISELNENKIDMDKESQRRVILEKMNNVSESDKQLIQDMNHLNPDLYKSLIENHKLKRKLFDDLKHIGDSVRNDFIKDTYHIQYRDESPKKEKKEPKEPKEKKVVKTKVPKLSDQQKNEIKGNIKELLKNTYKFKNKEECKSKQRTKDYYTSKEDIIKKIDSNIELKKLMPSNFKSLTKEKLCELLELN